MFRHLSIIGPTASGKSHLALELAKQRSGLEIVSIDSMQVYRGMDVGTAKPSKAEQSEVPHHLIDLVEPHEDFSLAQFQAAAFEVISQIEARGNTAVLTGGTGLYLQAVTDGLELPSQFPGVRAEIEAEAVTEVLHSRLAELDPLAASRMEPGNRRRVIRALEVTLGSGRPFSSFGPGVDAFPRTRFLTVGLWVPRAEGGRRIDDRVDQMIAAGWVDEVRRLTQNGQLSPTAAQALGYKELIEHLDGWDLEEATSEIKRRTRSFARRQRVWFRRDPRIVWLACKSDPASELPALLKQCQIHGIGSMQ